MNNQLCIWQGRLLAMAGSGYNLKNIADSWNAFVEALLK